MLITGCSQDSTELGINLILNDLPNSPQKLYYQCVLGKNKFLESDNRKIKRCLDEYIK